MPANINSAIASIPDKIGRSNGDEGISFEVEIPLSSSLICDILEVVVWYCPEITLLGEDEAGIIEDVTLDMAFDCKP